MHALQLQANLLQALELTNVNRFNSMIRKGAEIWKKNYVTSDRIIQEIKDYTIIKVPLGTFSKATLVKVL